METCCGQKTSVLQTSRLRVEEFQTGLAMSVGADLTTPDHKTAQGTSGVIGLDEADGLAGSQRRFSLDPGAMLGNVNGHPFMADFRIVRFNHQNNGFSDRLAIRAPGDRPGVTCHAVEGIQERRRLASDFLIRCVEVLNGCQLSGGIAT